MRHVRRRYVLLLCVLSSLGLGGLAAPAPSAATVVGIGDQKPETFADPLFQALNVKRSRYITPWNSIFTEPERLDAWINAARAGGIRETLIVFSHARGDECRNGRGCRLPSVRAYTRAFKAFRRKYPSIKTISPWDEINSLTQPTAKNPRRAAQFYNAVRANCRGCKVVAADIQDLSPRSMTRYLKRFLPHVKGKPRIWGLHNYTDTNRSRSSGTKTMLRLVKGEIWLTETGGIYKRRGSGNQLRPSESRQARATNYLFSRLVRPNRRRITRVYLYQWKVTNADDQFDAGLVNPDGSARKAYQVVRRNRSMIR